MSAPIIQTVRRLTPPTRHSDVICWEALNPQDKALRETRRLYRASLPAEERIPWRWIKRQVAGRVRWRYGEWQPHLLLARLHRRPPTGSPVVGFTYGAHVPGFGGYMGYIAVSQEQRGHDRVRQDFRAQH